MPGSRVGSLTRMFGSGSTMMTLIFDLTWCKPVWHANGWFFAGFLLHSNKQRHSQDSVDPLAGRCVAQLGLRTPRQKLLWMDEMLHHFPTMVETTVCCDLKGESNPSRVL